MEDNKLLYGGIAVIVLLLAYPFARPFLFDTSGYDPAQDTQNMERLYKAVEAYARDNRQYPPSLFYLVPKYIDQIPVTSTRQQFDYNPRTGKILNPATEPAVNNSKSAGRPSSERGGGAGIPPATEALTGLGASQELNF